MTESNKNIEIANGWVLCPSKSFPGKFYYFNVLNGETAWSLTQSGNKDFIKERGFPKIVDKSHGYTEPTTPQNLFTNSKKHDILNIPCSPQLAKFGQDLFPKYGTKVQPIIPKIVCTSLPFLMLCPETETKPMLDQKLSEFEYHTFAQYSKQTSIPLCQRFQNYKRSCFERNNKIVKPLANVETSTPKNLFLECISESQNLIPKTWIKEPTLKLERESPIPKFPDAIKSNAKAVISFGSKVGNTITSTKVPKFVKKEENLRNLNSSHLKRTSTEAIDSAVERKTPRLTESKPVTLKKKVSFYLKDETPDDSHDKTQQGFIPSTQNHIRTILEAPKCPGLPKDKSPLFIKQCPKTPPPKVEDQPPTLQPTANFFKGPMVKNIKWYIVVDTDVLLLDYEVIDKLVLSDPNCTLIIPHAVAADIEELCLGDCHGQQRVINARKLTRKLATPPPQYTVEPQTKESDNIIVTTDSILHCCMKVVDTNNFVVLITNDPHLQNRANLINIQSYKLNEIKYRVGIKPNFSPGKKTNKIGTPNDDVIDTKNLFNQSLFSNSEIKPEITSRNDVDGKNQYENHSLFRFNGSPIKKQLFLSANSENGFSLHCDKFTTTQTKDLKNNENIDKFDIDGLSDISSEVSSLTLIDKYVQIRSKNVVPQNASGNFVPQNVGKNPFIPQNVKKNGSVNFEKRNLNLNSVFNHTFSFRRAVPNEKPVSKPNNSKHGFHKDDLENSFENTRIPFDSKPITNVKVFEPKSKFENFVKPATSSSPREESFGVTRENNILKTSRIRTQKIMGTINTDSTTKIPLDNQIPKDSTGVFKVPMLPNKNATRNTYVPVENSNLNDQFGTRTNIDSIDENLTRFRIKSRNMKYKIKSRIDEWTCTYIQIMEDALLHILQKNCVCMENTVAPLTLQETLNCIKMLFGGHNKIREFTNKLSALLELSVLNTKGKSKMFLTPEDFMKIFGYGVLLIQVLKNNIHPPNEVLKEAEFRLNDLQTNLESNTIEYDPEFVKSSSLSKSDSDQCIEEIRPQFIKKKSDVLEYLKKHFKEWETYKEDSDDQNHTIENHTDFKVVRTLGKNLNHFKIDNKKVMFMSNNTLDETLVKTIKDEPKHIRQLENNQTKKPKITEILEINGNNDAKLMCNIENNQNTLNSFVDENKNVHDDVPLKKLVENIEKEQNKESKVDDDEFNYTTHESTFSNNTEKGGPKVIRNIKRMDEFEKKINKNKEPIDSDIHGPPVDRNYIIFEKNYDCEEVNTNNHIEDNNYGLDTPLCTLEDFCVTSSINSDSKSNNNASDFKNAENSSNKNKDTQNAENITSSSFNSVPENYDNNGHIEEKTDKNHSVAESDTFTEIEESQNENSNIHKFETNRVNSKILNNDSGTHLENSETYNDTFGKAAPMVIDDNTNDSGFENESTDAHTIIKIFLSELSSTYKAIHTFATKFVNEIRATQLSVKRKEALHSQASKALERMVAIIRLLKSIIKRESAENTTLKMLLLNAGVEATTDKRMTRYKQLVMKGLEQALILESALKAIVFTTLGDFEALSSYADSLDSNLRYFNIFE